MEPTFGYLDRVRVWFGDREREATVVGAFRTNSGWFIRILVDLGDGVEVGTACEVEELTLIRAA